MGKRKYRKCVLALLLSGLTFSATWPGEGSQLWVDQFPDREPGPVPAEWRSHDFSNGSPPTRYALVADGDRTVLKADSRESASAMVKRIEVDPSAYPYLEWSWKIEAPIEAAQWGVKEMDDFAARIFIIFEKEDGPFSFFGRLVTKGAGDFRGHALNYVWANDVGGGTLSPSPYLKNVMMIAVDSGGEKDGIWMKERRNVIEDYQKAFDALPGNIVAVAIMTDTDNTGSSTTAYYGDIRFLSR